MSLNIHMLDKAQKIKRMNEQRSRTFLLLIIYYWPGSYLYIFVYLPGQVNDFKEKLNAVPGLPFHFLLSSSDLS